MLCYLGWKEDIESAASHSNVYCKLSGLVTEVIIEIIADEARGLIGKYPTKKFCFKVSLGSIFYLSAPALTQTPTLF